VSFIGFLLSGLPIVGKGFDAFTNYTNKKMDSEVEKLRIDGKIDSEVIQARAQLAAVMKDDPATKIGRWFFVLPTGIWFSLITWRSVLQESSWSEYSWVIKAYPGNLEYIPYAVIAYLFVTTWRK
jgi:hypothetical protein